MTATTAEQKTTRSIGQLALHCATAGLGGGGVFGILMALMSMLPMVGMLVGQDSALVGFFVHLAISAFIGAVYGLVIDRFAATTPVALVGCVVYGIVWWVLGALIMMPLFLRMTDMVFVVGSMQWTSLLADILFGLVTAFLALLRRS